MKPGLDRMNKGLDLLGLSPVEIPVVQIVGTNGKGSTACFLEILARTHGLKTGLYTSPHLVSVRERIRVNNCLLSDDIWLDAAGQVVERCRGIDLTYFEVLTLMAVLIFQRERVDLAVIEAGLGGRHDATSALTPVVNVFTPVGLDHTLILGNTLKEIAADKAMAMKKGPVVISRQEPAVMDVFKSRADETGADIYPVPDYFYFQKEQMRSSDRPEMVVRTGDIGLKGLFQLDNAATALLSWKAFAEKKGVIPDIQLCLRALKEAFWPGRMHIIQEYPMVVLDGAHNPQAMKALKKGLIAMGIKPRTVIFSCVKDKDVGQLVEIVNSLGAENIFIPEIRENPRAMPKEELAALFRPHAFPMDNVIKYLSGFKKEEAPVLVCGSLYLLGEIYSAFPGWMER